MNWHITYTIFDAYGILLNNGYSVVDDMIEQEIKEGYQKYYDNDISKEKLDDFKHWWDAYKFFNRSGLYNPISIIGFLDEGTMISRWNNTSNSSKLRKIIKKYPSIQKICKQLISVDENHDKITIPYECNPRLVFEALDNKKDGFVSLLLHAGLLTKYSRTGDNSYKLVIPNNEVREEIASFYKLFLEKDSLKGRNALIDSVKNQSPKSFCTAFFQCLQTVSYRTINKKLEEASYELYMWGLLNHPLSSIDYTIINQENTPSGIIDLVIKPILGQDKGLPVWIIELKKPKHDKKDVTKSELKKEAKKALNQINNKTYTANYSKQKVENIIAIGLAFYRKDIAYVYEVKTLKEGIYKVSSSITVQYLASTSNLPSNRIKREYANEIGITTEQNQIRKAVENIEVPRTL